MLEQVINIQEDPTRKNQAKAIYLKKSNTIIKVENSISFQRITNHLNASLGTKKKHEILLFTEDKECIEFTKSILGRRYKHLNFIDTTFGCGNLIELARKKYQALRQTHQLSFLMEMLKPIESVNLTTLSLYQELNLPNNY
ncbi:hypothetical protein [Shewanella woodyi]|uniref:hypothetical protein n=1 Tax=Shewanella woodyi TaxID=60961 RepID=UPI0037490855